LSRPRGGPASRNRGWKKKKAFSPGAVSGRSWGGVFPSVSGERFLLNGGAGAAPAFGHFPGFPTPNPAITGYGGRFFSGGRTRFWVASPGGPGLLSSSGAPCCTSGSESVGANGPRGGARVFGDSSKGRQVFRRPGGKKGLKGCRTGFFFPKGTGAASGAGFLVRGAVRGGWHLRGGVSPVTTGRGGELSKFF